MSRRFLSLTAAGLICGGSLASAALAVGPVILPNGVQREAGPEILPNGVCREAGPEILPNGLLREGLDIEPNG